MRIYKLKRLIVLFIAFLLFSNTSMTQDSWIQNDSAKVSREKELRYWLGKSGLSDFYMFDTLLYNNQDLYEIRFNIPDERNLIEITNFYDSLYTQNINTILFKNTFLILEIDKQDLIIILDGADIKVYIKYNLDSDYISSEILRKMGIHDESNEDLSKMYLISSVLFDYYEDLEQTKNKLSKGLKEYFSHHLESDKHYIFETPVIIPRNTLEIKANHLKNEILNQNTFEQIEINFTFYEERSLFNCEISAKYCRGANNKAPPEGKYVDLPKNKEFIRYNSKIYQEIIKIIPQND